MYQKLENARARIFSCLTRDAQGQPLNLRGALFRSVILHTEVGDVLDCVHKKEEGVGLFDKEVELVFGQAGAQLIALMTLRDVWIDSDIDNDVRKRLSTTGNETLASRAALLGIMIARLCKFITHDPDINPHARPHGTKVQEIDEFAETLICLAVLACRCQVDFERALEVGLANWEEADWQKRQANSQNSTSLLKGITACAGSATGTIWVVNGQITELDLPLRTILVVPFAKPDLTQAHARLVGAITNHGGACCHMAIIARENGLPCIVGTGNATEILKPLHGKTAHVTVETDGTAVIALLPDVTC